MADNEEVHYERERSRSRDRGEPRDYHDDDVRGAGSVGSQQDDGAQYEDSRNNRNEGAGRRHEEDPDVNNLYVTNLSFQTTDESLRAAFQQFGEIHSASIIKEPVSQNSRGFGFVSFLALDDCEKALAAMHGAEVDGRSIRVEKARRNNGYQKTPGVYLGPPQLSARFVRDERGPRDRGYGGDRHGGGGYRGGYDREQRDPRDVRGGDRGGYGGGYPGHRGEDPRYPPAYQRGPPGGGYGDRGPPMYRDEGRYHPEPRFDPYPRGRDGPPPQRYDDRGPPRGAYYDGPRGGPHGGPGPMGGPMGGPGPMRNGGGRRSRSPPPRGGDDGRGPAPVNGGAPGGPAYGDRGGPPSGGYGGGAGYYPAGQNGPGGPPRGGARY